LQAKVAVAARAPAPVPPAAPPSTASTDYYSYVFDDETHSKRRLQQIQLPAVPAELPEVPPQLAGGYGSSSPDGPPAHRRLQQLEDAADEEDTGDAGEPPESGLGLVPDSQPTAAFGALSITPGVADFKWEPKVSVSPAAVSLMPGRAATLQHTITVTRTEQPPVALLNGQLQVSNPGPSVVRLVHVAVEVPAAGRAAWAWVAARCPTPGIIAAAAGGSAAGMDRRGSSSSSGSSLVGLVPPRSKLTCSFELLLPAAAPATGLLVARVVTEAGQEIASRPQPFSSRQQQQQQPRVRLGACALVSHTFVPASDAVGVVSPTMVPAVGSREAGASIRSSAGAALCGTASVAFTTTVGPFDEAQCGRYQVGPS
jgi:hypothetical protein